MSADDTHLCLDLLFLWFAMSISHNCVATCSTCVECAFCSAADSITFGDERYCDSRSERSRTSHTHKPTHTQPLGYLLKQCSCVWMFDTSSPTRYIKKRLFLRCQMSFLFRVCSHAFLYVLNRYLYFPSLCRSGSLAAFCCPWTLPQTTELMISLPWRFSES